MVGLALTYFFVYVVRQGVTSWFVFYLLQVGAQLLRWFVPCCAAPPGWLFTCSRCVASFVRLFDVLPAATFACVIVSHLAARLRPVCRTT